MDLLVRNVRVGERIVDVAIEGGRFARIGPDLDVDAARTVEAGGRLATPPLVDCHLHLDASLTAANPYFPVLADALQAPPNWRPRTDQWNAVETILGTELNKALTGGQTGDQAATNAATQIRALMKSKGYTP